MFNEMKFRETLEKFARSEYGRQLPELTPEELSEVLERSIGFD